MNAWSTIQFDLASVPREIRDDLARTLTLAVDAYFKQPGVEEKFQQWLVEYNKRKPEKRKPVHNGEGNATDGSKTAIAE